MDVVEQKYCRCIRKISKKNPRINPYGICTKSVYGSRNIKRGKVKCSKFYEQYSIRELRDIAKKKNIRVTENGRYKNKTRLIRDLRR